MKHAFRIIRDRWQHALAIAYWLAAAIAYGSGSYPRAAWFAFTCLVICVYAVANDLLDEIRRPRALPTCSNAHPRYGHACQLVRQHGGHHECGFETTRFTWDAR